MEPDDIEAQIIPLQMRDNHIEINVHAEGCSVIFHSNELDFDELQDRAEKLIKKICGDTIKQHEDDVNVS